MQAAGPLFAAALLTACATGPQPCTTRTEIRRVSQPAHIDIPDELIEPLEVPELSAPADDLDNRHLENDISHLEDIIDQCQADRAEIRDRQEKRQRERGERE